MKTDCNRLKSLLTIMIQNCLNPGPSKLTSLKRPPPMFGGCLALIKIQHIYSRKNNISSQIPSCTPHMIILVLLAIVYWDFRASWYIHRSMGKFTNLNSLANCTTSPVEVHELVDRYHYYGLLHNPPSNSYV